jgi:ABC-type transporter Mla MlaB component
LPEPDASVRGILFPMSVKGVLLDDGGVLLLENLVRQHSALSWALYCAAPPRSLCTASQLYSTPQHLVFGPWGPGRE